MLMKLWNKTVSVNHEAFVVNILNNLSIEALFKDFCKNAKNSDKYRIGGNQSGTMQRKKLAL